MPHETPTFDSLSPADQRVRGIVFWVLLLSASLALWSAHRLQAAYEHPLNGTDPTTGKPVSRTVPTGSFGAFLPQPRVPAGPERRIVLLGNSVYQACEIVERMQRLANDGGEPIEFVNLAQTGSGMHDHLARLPNALQFSPCLVVVAFVNLAFTADFGSMRLPRFRTDADQMVFDLDAIGRLPLSFLRREFTTATAAASLVSSVFPYKRLDPLIRLDVDRWLYWRLQGEFGFDPVAVRVLFPVPTLNMVGDWIASQSGWTGAQDHATPYPELPALMDEFLQISATQGVPVLFLRQESSTAYRPDVMPAVRQACAPHPAARVVDLQSAFVADRYLDLVHPAEVERDAYARRHYDAILQASRELPAPPRPSEAGR